MHQVLIRRLLALIFRYLPSWRISSAIAPISFSQMLKTMTRQLIVQIGSTFATARQIWLETPLPPSQWTYSQLEYSPSIEQRQCQPKVFHYAVSYDQIELLTELEQPIVFVHRMSERQFLVVFVVRPELHSLLISFEHHWATLFSRSSSRVDL